MLQTYCQLSRPQGLGPNWILGAWLPCHAHCIQCRNVFSACRPWMIDWRVYTSVFSIGTIEEKNHRNQHVCHFFFYWIEQILLLRIPSFFRLLLCMISKLFSSATVRDFQAFFVCYCCAWFPSFFRLLMCGWAMSMSYFLFSSLWGKFDYKQENNSVIRPP
jgi:hypothetical protein